MKNIARKLLGLILKGTVLPIISGPLRGSKWTVGIGTHGYWLGTYERPIQRRLANHTAKGSVLFDIGANVGFYSLLGSKLVGNQCQVPVVENVSVLRRQRFVKPLSKCRHT